MSRSLGLKALLAGLCLGAALVSGVSDARAPARDETMPTVTAAELPSEGSRMLVLIRQGGPFATEKDGVVFANRERLLPPNTRGYYREYTVPTPGLRHRGVRRIVCGGRPRVPDACYYTADHYASFRRIVP